MLRKRLGQILTVLMATVATGHPLNPAVFLAAPAMAQEAQASCFAGIDYTTLSLDNLHDLVAQAISQMNPGMTDEEIARELGRQLGASATNCSATQVAALLKNVSVILGDMGIEGTAATALVAALAEGFVTTPTAIVAGDDLAATVAGVY